MILPLIGRMGLSWQLRVWWWWWSWQPEHPWPSKPLWLVPLLSQKPPEEIFLQDLFGGAFSIMAVLHSPFAYEFSCLSALLQKGTWGITLKVYLSLSNFYNIWQNAYFVCSHLLLRWFFCKSLLGRRCACFFECCEAVLDLLRCKGILHELPDRLPEHILHRGGGAFRSILETFRFTCSGVKMERVPTSSILLLCTLDGRKTCSDPSWGKVVWKVGLEIEFTAAGR